MIARRDALRGLLLVAAAASLGACRNPLDRCAYDLGRYGIVATVVDSTTGGQPSAAPRMELSDGAYREASIFAMRPDGQQVQLMGAAGRTGTYDVVITAPGYQTWTRSGVRVEEDFCSHVTSVELLVKLQPLP